MKIYTKECLPLILMFAPNLPFTWRSLDGWNDLLVLPSSNFQVKLATYWNYT